MKFPTLPHPIRKRAETEGEAGEREGGSDRKDVDAQRGAGCVFFFRGPAEARGALERSLEMLHSRMSFSSIYICPGL